MDNEVTFITQAANGREHEWETHGTCWEDTGADDGDEWENSRKTGESLNAELGISDHGLTCTKEEGASGTSKSASKGSADAPLSAGVLFQMIADLLPTGHGFDDDRQIIFACRSDETREDICGPIAVLRSVHDMDGTNWSHAFKSRCNACCQGRSPPQTTWLMTATRPVDEVSRCRRNDIKNDHSIATPATPPFPANRGISIGIKR